MSSIAFGTRSDNEQPAFTLKIPLCEQEEFEVVAVQAGDEVVRFDRYLFGAAVRPAEHGLDPRRKTGEQGYPLLQFHLDYTVKFICLKRKLSGTDLAGQQENILELVFFHAGRKAIHEDPAAERHKLIE